MENEWTKALEEKDAEIARLKNQIGGVMLHLPKDTVIMDANKLRELEWINDPEYGESYCRVCQAWKTDGHKEDCWLGNILKESS